MRRTHPELLQASMVEGWCSESVLALVPQLERNSSTVEMVWRDQSSAFLLVRLRPCPFHEQGAAEVERRSDLKAGAESCSSEFRSTDESGKTLGLPQ